MKNQPIWRRFLYGFNGIRESLRTEASFRTEVVIGMLVILLLLVTRPAPFWWAIILLTCGMVLVTELLNTAVEKLIDHLHPALHDTVGVVKDTLAGAVQISCAIALGVLAAFLWAEYDSVVGLPHN